MITATFHGIHGFSVTFDVDDTGVWTVVESSRSAQNVGWYVGYHRRDVDRSHSHFTFTPSVHTWITEEPED